MQLFSQKCYKNPQHKAYPYAVANFNTQDAVY